MKVSQNSELIAKRWAKALMELANENQGISKVDILDDLKEVDENIRYSAELSNVINNPSISVEEKQIVLCKLDYCQSLYVYWIVRTYNKVCFHTWNL